MPISELRYNSSMDIVQRIKDDFVFTRENEPELRLAPILRTVAALNPDATRDEFLKACLQLDLNPITIRRQFLESRQFDVASYGGHVDPEGRYHEPV